MKPLVSAVIPMHNEEENAAETLARLGDALMEQGWAIELIPVNDGSTDGTAEELARIAAESRHVRPVSYRKNRGRGYALRQGFAVASGEYVVSLDADLSYSPDHAVRMIRMLLDDPDLDIVLASPYMPGGGVENVPFARLAISRAGNVVLRHSLPQPIYTSTGIARAYRAEVLRSLDLASDGKEIHLEILSDAMALGYRIAEMPSILRARQKGRSKFRPKATMISHLAFTLLERSAVLFAFGGAALLLAGLALAVYLLAVFATGNLNPERPLMTVMVLLFLGGAVGLSFSLLSMLMLEMRRTLVRTQAEVVRLRRDLADARTPFESAPAAEHSA